MKHQNQQPEKGKHQKRAEQKSAPQQKEVPLAEAIATLKKQILAEVRLVSTGVKASIYELIEMDKELAVLETDGKSEESQETSGPEVSVDEF